MALDFFAGCMGGCAGVLVGHPLDTIKVRLQTQDFRNPQYRGTIHCFKTIVEKESVRGLYKGISSPVVGVAFVNAIVFGVYGNIQRRMPEPDSLRSHFMAGAAAGLAQSFVCSPMELAKTRMQLQGDAGAAGDMRYRNPFHCLQAVKKAEGWRGVFRGQTATLCREVPGFGTYFLSYEVLTRSLQSSNKEPLSTPLLLFAGGMAGCISWLVAYPTDVVKSRLQADTRYSGIADCIKQGMKDEGPKFLTRGLSSTLVRSFPTNAATFAAVTWVMRLAGVSEVANESYISASEFNDDMLRIALGGAVQSSVGLVARRKASLDHAALSVNGEEGEEAARHVKTSAGTKLLAKLGSLREERLVRDVESALEFT